MTTKKLNAMAGFAPLELSLILVGVLIIGFVAWDVYHIKSTSDALLAPSTSSSPTFKAKAATSTASSTTAASTTDSDSSLQTDLNAANSANSQSAQDMATANSGLNDQSTFTTIPQ